MGKLKDEGSRGRQTWSPKGQRRKMMKHHCSENYMLPYLIEFSSVQFSRSVGSDSL